MKYKTVLWVIMIFIVMVSLYRNREDPVLIEVKRRYDILANDPPPGMEELKEKTVITGFRERYGEIGYNVNKGDEIGLCLDGSVNEVFHVLIHELAHTVSRTYAHDEHFWNNFKIIREHCINKGIYQPINIRTDFCGKFIRD